MSYGDLKSYILKLAVYDFNFPSHWKIPSLSLPTQKFEFFQIWHKNIGYYVIGKYVILIFKH